MAIGLTRWTSALAFGLCAAGATAAAEDGTPLPSTPAPRRLTFGTEAFASLATEDNGYFNYSSYGQSAMRLLRLRVDLSLRLGARAALLAEGRMDNGDGPSLSALYLRVRPFPDRALDIQAGRIPPVFGAFARRSYGADNPLIGQPLAYQYLTSLRSDALPASADDLLKMRGQGWASHYPIGSAAWDPGLPLVAADRWDTGVQVRVAGGPVTAAAALSQGTLSNPRVRDDNSGKQVSGRVEARPVLGLVLGASAARGDYISRGVRMALPAAARDASHTQRAFGADAEFSRGYWLFRAEGVLSRWSLPPVEEPFVTSPLGAWGVFVEARRKIRPGLFAAARLDHVGFSRVTGTLYGGRPTPWDAPVSRVEVGAGFSLRRNLLLKAALQQDWRAGATHGERIAAAQALFWF